ncbi:SIR2 family NAD-dependent protein deacylase [Algiphilus aromaticivorans]|uniref:SIR2 family NAD-dependent protein deacylase n=1 Tax=Algiphilus aromaticivorans TaxID=382454 RepID=UPI0005C1F519|nr:NAD-dependent deacylase [Algiphilus aromaticivorans]
MTQPLDLSDFERAVFFTGAGISAESGVPTYRGRAGIWAEYDPEKVASQAAFERDPETVLAFHEQRRALVAACAPNAAHRHIAAWQADHSGVSVITQNTDGLHETAGSSDVVELHGSLWRTRCARHGVLKDRSDGPYQRRDCPECGARLRPDITWFGDMVDTTAFEEAGRRVEAADLFVAVGTSGVVWPAAGFIELAARSGARMIEINPEPSEASVAFSTQLRQPAAEALPTLFPLPAD